MKAILLALVAIAALFSFESRAQSPCLSLGEVLVCTGSASADDALLFTTNDVVAYDVCMLLSHDGAVDVEGALDTVPNWSAALALEQRGSTSTDKVMATTADVMFNVVGKYRRLRVRQAGITAAAATLLCWDRSR